METVKRTIAFNIVPIQKRILMMMVMCLTHILDANVQCRSIFECVCVYMCVCKLTGVYVGVYNVVYANTTSTTDRGSSSLVHGQSRVTQTYIDTYMHADLYCVAHTHTHKTVD